MKCLRCGLEIPKEEANSSTNYHVHSVCSSCRLIMAKRLDYLIEADKKFHKTEKESYELTVSYLTYLLINKKKSNK